MGWGQTTGEPAESSSGVWWAGRTGQKDGLEGGWTGLADGLNLGPGDEKGNQSDSWVGLEWPGRCRGLHAVKERPEQVCGECRAENQGPTFQLCGWRCFLGLQVRGGCKAPG